MSFLRLFNGLSVNELVVEVELKEVGTFLECPFEIDSFSRCESFISESLKPEN